jgi:hypothetical protein
MGAKGNYPLFLFLFFCGVGEEIRKWQKIALELTVG